MMTTKIEDIDLAAVKLPKHKRQLVLSSKDCRGLQFVLKSTGKQEWRFRYTRPDGRRTTVTLAATDYPAAVKEAEAERLKLRRGIDPVDSRKLAVVRERQNALAKGHSVKAEYRLSRIAADFLGHAEDTLKPASVNKYRTAINVHLIPLCGSYDVRLFDFTEYESGISQIAKRSKSAASNAHRTCRALLSFAVEKGLIDANPLLGRKSLVKRLRVEPRREYLTGSEISQFLADLETADLSEDIELALRLQLYTGARIGELCSLEWKRIDFKARTATLPASLVKGNREAEIILSDTVRRLLLEWKKATLDRKGDRVFVADLDTDAVIAALRKVKGWTVKTHDIRRTVRTHLTEMGCPAEIRAMITNHSGPAAALSDHYDITRNRREQLVWLEKWATALEHPERLSAGIDAGDDDPLLAEFADVI